MAFPSAATAPSTARAAPKQTDCGDLGIKIARDGTWFYHGSPINRKPMVRLFSTVLRRDKCGDFVLETPVERGRITVDDAPFVAVALEAAGSGREQTLTFVTNVDDRVTADREHPMRVATDERGGPAPYVLVRGRLEARIARAVFYQMIELGIEIAGPAGPHLGVWSGGACFDLGPVA